jgi:hypothetical protein
MADNGTITESEEALLDKRLAGTLNTFIASQSCVLLLGPLFGVDQDDQKIHLVLKNLLTSPPNELQLDDEFDNLYISKSSDGAQNADLINQMYTYYQGLGRNAIYDKILDIGFRAIITYTSDLLLYEANTVKNEYDFSFFSAKSNQLLNDQNQLPAVVSKRPIIYNIFGNINDLNTLITDYDSLYDFLINILKADQEFPLQLKNILSNAKAFLFLGFDLSKWYIPLLVRKLNQFILNGTRAKTSVSAFACLDDTPVVPPRSVTDSINKYPLVFKPFAQISSIELIHTLAQLPKRPARPNGIELRQPTQAERDFFAKWNMRLKEYGSSEGLQAFFQAYRELNYGGMLKKELDILAMQYNEYVSQRMSMRLSDEDFTVGCNKIIDSLLNYIPKLL